MRKAAADCGAASLPEGVSVVNATEVIEICDDPATAFKHKKDSSITVGLTLLKNGEGDAFVSAGSTGALLAAATLLVKRVKGIRRAAMCPVIPTAGGSAVLIDCGANAECSPEYLLQFAYLGSFYVKQLLGIPNPRVAFSTSAPSPPRGTPAPGDLRPSAAAHDRAAELCGEYRGQGGIKGGCDVIVADGFSGNVMLKTIEGVAPTWAGK